MTEPTQRDLDKMVRNLAAMWRVYKHSTKGGRVRAAIIDVGRAARKMQQEKRGQRR